MGFLRKTVVRTESSGRGTLFWAGLFIAAILVRNIIEGPLGRQHSMQNLFNILVHYPLWYLCLFLALCIFVSVVSKAQVEKTAKFMAVLWIGIVAVPVIDYIVSGGKGFSMSYILLEPNLLLESLLQIGKGFVTPGQAMVVFGGAAVFAAYSFIKTGKLSRALAAGLGSYLIVFFFASIPSLVLPVYGFEIPPSGLEVAVSEKAMAASYVAMLLIELSLFGFLWNLKKTLTVLKNARLERAMIYASMVLLGGAIAGINSLFSIAVCMAAALLAFESGMLLNNAFDSEHGKETEKKEVIFISVVLGVIAVMLAATANQTVALLTGGALVVSAAYSIPNGLKKKLGFANNFALAGIAVFEILAGFYSQNPLAGFPAEYGLLAFIALGIAFNAKDLKDEKKDRERKIKTLPVLLGQKKAKEISAVLVLIAYLLVPVFTGKLMAEAIVFGAASWILFRAKGNEKMLILIFIAFACLLTLAAL